MSEQLGPKGGLVLSSVFFVVGLGLMWLLCWAIYFGASPYFWDKVECRIGSSTTKTTNNLYHFVVEYTYEYERVAYVSDKVSPWYSGDSDYSKVKKLLDTYPKGSKRKCYVNPDDPYDSVLKIDVEWILFPLMILPLAFFFGGFYQMRRAWKALSKPRWDSHYNEEAVFSTGGKWGGILVSSIFLIPGVLFFLLYFLLPTAKIVSAQWWDEVPCIIISSKYIVRHGGSDSIIEYTLDILYSYKYTEKEYKSNNYDLFNARSSDLTFIKSIVARYPSGAVKTCYVNPDQPKEAALYKNFYLQLLFYAIFPLPFIAIGFYGFYRLLFKPVKAIDHVIEKVVSMPSFFNNLFLKFKREYDKIFKNH